MIQETDGMQIKGPGHQKLVKSTNMVVKAINPNAEGNQGLLNRMKIRLGILSGVMQMVFNNNVTLRSYKSFLIEKKSFCYTDEVTYRIFFRAHYSKARDSRDEASAYCQCTGPLETHGETGPPNMWEQRF